jgi:hypothetical protein
MFRATTDFGGDGYTSFEVSLDDDEAERLEAAMADEDIYDAGFSDCDELSDIYDKAYTEALDVLTEELRDTVFEDDDIDEDDDDYISPEEWRVNDTYSVTVHFPEL